MDWADIRRGGVEGGVSIALLVDPGSLVGLPADQLLRLEPERNLLLGRLHSVRAVADVATNLNTIKISISSRPVFRIRIRCVFDPWISNLSHSKKGRKAKKLFEENHESRPDVRKTILNPEKHWQNADTKTPYYRSKILKCKTSGITK